MHIKERIKNRLEPAQALLTKGMTLANLPNPGTMLNNRAAAELLLEKIEDGDQILIVGDYDADGILGTSILYGFLCDIGLGRNVEYIIPSRLKDGYGLTMNIIDYAIEKGFNTIVTVDNGISAVEPIKKAKENGLTVIITDHHTAPKKLPNADYIVNPKQPGETFPFINISGATVAWYFCCQLKELLGIKIDMRNYLDLAGLTVISDVMPLDNINLIILNYTLRRIKEDKGFRYIYDLAWDERRLPCVNETSIGFDLVPMINAIGRINDANKGVELFLSRDKNRILELFEEVKEINKDRKDKTQNYLSVASLDVDTSKKAIIIRNKEFHEGIVGIIAGKLAEQHKKPAYVFSWNEEKNLWKGSGRSTGNIHLYDLTNEAVEYTAGFGGHKGAVGIGIKPENYDKFVETIEQKAEEIDEELFFDASSEPIDCNLEELSLEVLDYIETFGPFGEANRLPLFRVKNVNIYPERELTGGRHFATTVKQGNVNMKAMFFHIPNKEYFLEAITEEQDIYFNINRNYDPRKEEYGFEIFCKLKTV